MTDPEIIRLGAACLVGWAAGVALAMSCFWRRITRPADGTVRLLRMRCDDADAQIRALYAQIGRLTARLVADVAEAEADASGKVA